MYCTHTHYTECACTCVRTRYTLYTIHYTLYTIHYTMHYLRKGFYLHWYKLEDGNIPRTFAELKLFTFPLVVDIFHLVYGAGEEIRRRGGGKGIKEEQQERRTAYEYVYKVDAPQHT